MAKHQCPNCGGFKSLCWLDWYGGDLIKMAILTACTFGIAAVVTVPVVLWNWFKRPGSVLGYRYCEICEYGWETRAASPARPMLAQARQAEANRQYAGN